MCADRGGFVSSGGLFSGVTLSRRKYEGFVILN